MPLALMLVAAFASGMVLWTLAEYLLHRFAMHALGGRGMMSREHLEHHVTAGWTLSWTHVLSWTGMLLVGATVWAPLGWLLAGPVVGLAFALGWVAGYSTYEYQHAVAHLRPPRTRYQHLVRRHHFHHHFGAPLANHGVTVPFWDRAFGTHERPERVRVPRRLAPAWLLDADGEVRSIFATDYELVGAVDAGERLQKLDRARAFASVAPAD